MFLGIKPNTGMELAFALKIRRVDGVTVRKGPRTMRTGCLVLVGWFPSSTFFILYIFRTSFTVFSKYGK